MKDVEKDTTMCQGCGEMRYKCWCDEMCPYCDKTLYNCSSESDTGECSKKIEE